MKSKPAGCTHQGIERLILMSGPPLKNIFQRVILREMVEIFINKSETDTVNINK